jgi:hypothetical protein
VAVRAVVAVIEDTPNLDIHKICGVGLDLSDVPSEDFDRGIKLRECGGNLRGH